MLLGAFICGIGLGGVFSIIWGMIADCAEEILALTGHRSEGLLFSAAVLSQQAALGIAAGAYGVMLSAAGYGLGAATESIRTVFLCFGFGLPIIGSAATILLLRFYKLSHARHCILRSHVGAA